MTVGPWIDRAYVGILPDFSRFSREAEAGITRSLKGLQRDADRAADDIDRRFEQLGRDMGRQLDSVGTSARVKVKPEVDASGIHRARLAARDLRDELLRAGATVGALRSLGRFSLGAGLVAAVPAAFSLASALSTVAGLAAAAPAALAAVGTAGAAAALGFSGVTDAVKALNESMSEGTPAAAEKAKEALENLSPAGQRFARFLVGLRDEFEDLRDTAQAGLLPGVEAGIRSLLPLLPLLERQLGAVARTMGDLAEEAGGRIAQRSRDLGRLFETNTRFIDDLGEAGLDLVEVFIDLGVAAQPLVRWIGALVRGWAENTREAVAAARANGSLTRFFARTRETLETVFSIVGNVTGAVRNLGVLAFPSGTGLLGSLDAATEKLEDFTARLLEIDFSPVSGAGRKIIDSIEDALEGGDWGGVADAVGEGLADALEFAAAGAASAVIDGLVLGLRSGDWGPLGDAIGERMVELPLAVSNAVRRIDWRSVGQQTAHALVPFALGLAGGLFDAIVDAFREDFWGTLFDIAMIVPIGRAAGALLRIVPGLVRVPLLGGLLRSFQGLGGAIEAPIRGFVNRFGAGLAEGFTRWFPRLSKILDDGVGGFVRNILGRVRNFREAGGSLIQGLGRGIGDLAGFITRSIGLTIGRLLNPFRGIGRWLLREGGDLLRGLLAGLRGLWGDVSLGIRLTISRLLDPFRGISRWLVREGGDLLRGLISGIRSILGALSSIVSATIGRIRNPFSGALRWLSAAGQNIIDGLVSGMRSALGAIGGIIRDVKDAIVGGIRRLFNMGSPSKVMAELGGFIISGLVKGLVRDRGFLTAVLKDIGGDIDELFAGAGGGGAGGLVGFAKTAFGMFRGLFPGMTIGGYRSRGSVPGSDHPKGKALDLMTTSSLIANTIISVFRAMPGAKYWIWNRQIASASSGWRTRPYSGPSPHTDHVHLSFFDRGGYLKPGFTPSWNFTGTPERVLNPVETRVWERLEEALSTRTGPVPTPAADRVVVQVAPGAIQIDARGATPEAAPAIRASVEEGLFAVLQQFRTGSRP